MTDFTEHIALRARRLQAEGQYNDLFPAGSPLDPLVPHEKIRAAKPPQSPYTINNALWMVASLAVFYYTDFALTLLYDPRVHRIWLKLGVGLICVNVSIGAFLIVYLSWIKKIPTEHWERKFPAAVPFATAAFILGTFCLIVALWPVWHIFTPLILFILFMGVVVFIAIMPSF